MSGRKFHRALPQNLHVMPKGHSVVRACGATSGGFVRVRDAEWLRKFLRDGGKLCAPCAKWLEENGEESARP